MLAATTKDGIAVVHRPAAAFAAVRRLFQNLVGDGFIEVELRSEILGARRLRTADFEVDMHRAAFVPTRIDGAEFRAAVCAGLLVTAQKLLSAGVEAGVTHVRIDAEGVAMPNIDDGAGERGAGACGDARNMELQSQRNSGLD